MIYPCHCAYHHYNAGFHTYACSLLSLLPCIHVGIQRKRGINLVFGYGSHQKKTGKKLHNSCELWEGGVSKFWCVNLKKVLFLELIFQKKHAEINS